jgi:hypothetical protein
LAEYERMIMNSVSWRFLLIYMINISYNLHKIFSQSHSNKIYFFADES